MADKKPSSLYYTNLGGVNLKASEYVLGKGQFLDIRNMDFDVPNALQKRPGSTQTVSAGTSGPVIGLFEFQKLTGESWIVAGSDSALFYLAGNAYTLLDSGWNNGQPQDFLTFVNKMWVADGGRYKSWDGGASFGVQHAMLPCPVTGLSLYGATIYPSAAFPSLAPNEVFLVGGETMISWPPASSEASFIALGVYMAYSYIRNDGRQGPLDLISNARNIIVANPPDSSTHEWFDTYQQNVGGVTLPAPDYGISGIKLWLAVDKVLPSSPYDQNVGSLVGDIGYAVNVSPNSGEAISLNTRVKQIINSRFNGFSSYPQVYMSVTLKPTADTSKFWLYATVPGASLLLGNKGGQTFYGFQAQPYLAMSQSPGVPTFGSFSGLPPLGTGYSGSTVCLFGTSAPKYIDVNQNVMFMSGFSSAPSDVWFSEIGDPATVLIQNQFEVRTNDGDRIMGHRAYNNTIIAFKENSFHKIIGSTPEDFQLVELSTEFGCLSNNATAEFNEKLLFLDKKGIVQYDGAGWRIISDAVDDIFRSMNLSAAKEKAVAVHHNYRNQVWFGIPVNGSTENNLTVVYDYLVNAFTFFDGFDVSSFAFMKSTLPKPTVWRGSPSGMIYYHSESFYGDNGQGISCVPFTRFEQFKGENSTNVWRRLFLDVGAVTGLTGIINGAVYSDYDHSTVRATFSMPQNVFQSKAEMGVVGKAVAVKFSHYSESLPFLLNGFTWQKRNLRNV